MNGRFHLPNLFSQVMESRAFKAVFLTLVMLLSGCLGSEDSEIEKPEQVSQTDISANLTLEVSNSNLVVGDIAIIEALVWINSQEIVYYVESDIITPSGIRQIETTSSKIDDGYRIILMPDEPGTWQINSRLIVDGLDDSIKESMQFNVANPDASASRYQS